jgi:DNA repair exonuclease SbcCD ATPase subunit
MDRQSLEFLGNFFLAVAQGQKQLEDMRDWMSGKKSTFDEWTPMFRRCFGLEKEEANSTAWTQAMQQFQASVTDWLTLMNVVPKSEFEALQKENEALQQKNAEQEKTIQHLQGLFSEKGTHLLDAAQEFSRMTAQQSEQFQELMGSMGELFRTDKDSSKA